MHWNVWHTVVSNAARCMFVSATCVCATCMCAYVYVYVRVCERGCAFQGVASVCVCVSV